MSLGSKVEIEMLERVDLFVGLERGWSEANFCLEFGTLKSIRTIQIDGALLVVQRYVELV